MAAVVTDSRQVGPGDLFVALRGERFDAHDFVAQAVARGAGAVVVDRPVDVPAGCVVFQVDDTLLAYGRLAAAWRRRHEAKVLAVTGSTGKSSIKEVLATVLATRCVTLSAEKSFNNEVGVPATLLKPTPAHQAVVLELAMRGEGQIDYLARIARPVVGVITNIGMSHLELLVRASHRPGEGRLLDHLGADGVAVLNQDRQVWRRRRGGMPAARSGTVLTRRPRSGGGRGAPRTVRQPVPAGDGGGRGDGRVWSAGPAHDLERSGGGGGGLAAGLELDDVVTGLGAARNLPLRLGGDRVAWRAAADQRRLQRRARFGPCGAAGAGQRAGRPAGGLSRQMLGWGRWRGGGASAGGAMTPPRWRTSWWWSANSSAMSPTGPGMRATRGLPCRRRARSWPALLADPDTNRGSDPAEGQPSRGPGSRRGEPGAGRMNGHQQGAAQHEYLQDLPRSPWPWSRSVWWWCTAPPTPAPRTNTRCESPKRSSRASGSGCPAAQAIEEASGGAAVGHAAAVDVGRARHLTLLLGFYFRTAGSARAALPGS
ncbi:MAG: UDP-N-acetylmuramoyl-tripeptide--D-alanyl-D-alanine ligase [Gammaproteobacteria bacterium]|nr:UDP-N-acetylmuramoyl-tripeptide--D-alanyl-D-alanine ligase [Gammaproteobacteria bacterium]